jgi:hypothetical protein
MRMRVPRRPRPRLERHTRGPHARWRFHRGDRVEPHRAGEVLGIATLGGTTFSAEDFHASSQSFSLPGCDVGFPVHQRADGSGRLMTAIRKLQPLQKPRQLLFRVELHRSQPRIAETVIRDGIIEERCRAGEDGFARRSTVGGAWSRGKLGRGLHAAVYRISRSRTRRRQPHLKVGAEPVLAAELNPVQRDFLRAFLRFLFTLTEV